jgi:hypothetical protein
VLHPKWRFVFQEEFRYLNFHPLIKEQVQDMLCGHVEREYDDAASDISSNDYVGHMASSQALCWNVVLPMKKHDNFSPLFETLREQLSEEGLDSEFDFGIETAVVLELNVAQDLGERGAATSIDLYLRTAQGRVCAIEFKLSEPDFCRCKLPHERRRCDGRYGNPAYIQVNDGYLCYLAKIGRRYWHLGGQYNLLDPTRVATSNVDLVWRCPLNEFYQPLRNLMVAKKRAEEVSGKGVRGIFILAADERNSAFWGPGNRFDRFREYLREIRGETIPDVFRVSIQDIVARFSNSLADYKEFFTVKYGFPPDNKLSNAGVTIASNKRGDC